MTILLILVGFVVTAPIFYFVFKKDEDESLNSKTSGTISIYAEESSKPLTQALIAAFQQKNPDTRFELESGNEKAAFDALLNDTCSLVVMPRGLTEKEQQIFYARYFMPRNVAFAREQQSGSAERSFHLFNNQTREGLGKAFMAFVGSPAAGEVVASLGFEHVTKKNKTPKMAVAA